MARDPVILPRGLTLHRLVSQAISAFDAHGDIVRLALPVPVFCLRNPDHIKAVAALTRKPAIMQNADWFMGSGIFNDLGGETWHAKRRTLAPLFGDDTTARHVGLLPDSLERMGSRWTRPVDLYAEMCRLVVCLTAHAGFSTWLNDVDLDWLTAAAKRAESMFVSPVPWWLPTSSNKRSRADKVRMVQMFGDFWLSASLPDAAPEAMSYFFGAHAMALTLFWGVRAAFMRPAVLGALRDDADGSYARMFLNEVLRLWPSFWGSLRSSDSIEFDGMDFPGRSVFAMIRVAAQRHPAYWPDPLRFDPERHAVRNSCPHAVMPFGLGPRMCVGRSLALAICTQAIRWIVQTFDMTIPPGDMPLRYGFGMYPALPLVAHALRIR